MDKKYGFNKKYIKNRTFKEPEWKKMKKNKKENLRVCVLFDFH